MNRCAKLAFGAVAIGFFAMYLALPAAILWLCIANYDRVGVGGLVGGAFVALLCLAPLWATFRESRSIRKRKEGIKATRRPMTDEEFLKDLDVSPELRPVCVRVRKALAAAVGIPAELLYPAETVEDYGQLQSVGPDYVEIQIALEREFGFKMSKGMEKTCEKLLPWTRPDKFTVGQMASHLTVWLADSLPDPKRELSTGGPAHEK